MDTTFNKLGDFGMPDFITWLGYIVLHCPGLWHVLLHLKVKSGAILMVKKDNFAAFLSLHFTWCYCAHERHLCPLFESTMLLNQILPLLWQFYSQVSTLSLLNCSSLPLSSHPHIFSKILWGSLLLFSSICSALTVKQKCSPPNNLVSVVCCCRNSAGTLGLGLILCGISKEKLQVLERSKTAGP